MKPDAYQRNLAARAFDVARYTLFFGIPTGVGQVTSIRTLERQIRRLKASQYAEIRDLAEEIAAACAQPPACAWDEKTAAEPLAPTLARHVEIDQHALQSAEDLEAWARENVSIPPSPVEPSICCGPTHMHAEIAATLLYPVTDLPFRDLYELACSWSPAQRNEVIDVALRSRTRRDELLRGFRGGLYAYDIVMDIGAYRDMHRHRRCQQYRQAYSGRLGFDTPQALHDAGIAENYEAVMPETFSTPCSTFPSPPRITCCLSARAPASSSRWISPKPNTSRAFAAASKVTSAIVKSPGK